MDTLLTTGSLREELVTSKSFSKVPTHQICSSIYKTYTQTCMQLHAIKDQSMWWVLWNVQL